MSVSRPPGKKLIKFAWAEMQVGMPRGKCAVVVLAAWAVVVTLLLFAEPQLFMTAKPCKEFQYTEPERTTEKPTQIILPDPEPEQSSDCRWRFVRYHQSEWEREWEENIKAWAAKPCVEQNKEQAKVDTWLEWIKKADSTATPPSEVFSFFEYETLCEEQGEGEGQSIRVAIEPLVGTTRHPLVCKDVHKYMTHRGYLLLDPTIKQQVDLVKQTGGRVIYYDLGASVWNEGLGGASLSWMADEYKKKGVVIDQIYAWEAKQQDPGKVWNAVPIEYLHKFTWFNVPVTDEKGHRHNPFRFLRATARKKDYVIFKLDIDTPILERALVEQIIADPEITQLIDEMYFEHHIKADPLTKLWGEGRYSETLVDTLSLFMPLRRAGVRLHSWP